MPVGLEIKEERTRKRRGKGKRKENVKRKGKERERVGGKLFILFYLLLNYTHSHVIYT
jgi:hypothetical protein